MIFALFSAHKPRWFVQLTPLRVSSIVHSWISSTNFFYFSFFFSFVIFPPVYGELNCFLTKSIRDVWKIGLLCQKFFIFLLWFSFCFVICEIVNSWNSKMQIRNFYIHSFFFSFFKNISWCKHSGMDDYVKKSYKVLVSNERFSWFWFYKIVFHKL